MTSTSVNLPTTCMRPVGDIKVHGGKRHSRSHGNTDTCGFLISDVHPVLANALEISPPSSAPAPAEGT